MSQPPSPQPTLPPLSARARAERLARFLDDAFTLPGTSIRFGWDALIGLIPGLGDVLTTLLALGIVAEAWRAGAPVSVLTRMLANLGVDATVGSIPVLGDVADVAFRANRRNARLLLAWHEDPRGARRRSRWLLTAGLLTLVALSVTLLAGAAFLGIRLFHAFSGG